MKPHYKRKIQKNRYKNVLQLPAIIATAFNNNKLLMMMLVQEDCTCLTLIHFSPVNVEQLQRESLRSSWTSSLMQSDDRPQTTGQLFQTVAEDIFYLVNRTKKQCEYSSLTVL